MTALEPDCRTLNIAVARRRRLTLLFSDLSRSTDLAAAMEAEDYADLLCGLREAFEAVIPRHGGTIVQVQGDGVLAMFGYPEAGEYDGRRATEAALELHHAVRGLSDRLALPGANALTLHSGVHAGLVLVDEGDAVRGRYGLLGNAVNIAARLSDAAASDEILVSEETLAAETYFFETGDTTLLPLQGVARPVAVRNVHGRAPVITRFAARTRRGLSPFVGRKDELKALEAALRQSLSGRARTIAILAPPGVGKTRLAEEFLQRPATRACLVHRGYCESYLSAEPLQPLLQMLRALCGLTRGMAANEAARALEQTFVELGVDAELCRDPLLRALSFGSAAADGGRLSRHNTIAALRAVFEALARRGPQVLFIDDWHWADDLTRQALSAIRRLEGSSILVLVTSRDAGESPVELRGARLVHLTPFSAEETNETIFRLLTGRDPILAAEIRTCSGGNPLFIEELCHAAAQSATAPPEGWGRPLGRAPSGVAWLSGLIESRVERLPPVHGELVRTASVIGNVIPGWLLESLTGYGADHPVLRALADQDLILPGEEPGTLRFKHGIARDVIYEAVGLRQRRALHLRIAETLRRYASGAEEEFYESLAYHYDASGDAAEAARYAELAGDKAVAASALDRAQLQYRAALAALDRLPPSDAGYAQWMTLSQKLAMVAVFDPSRDQLAVFQRAIDLAAERDDRPRVAAAEFWLGYANYALGDAVAAAVHLQRTLALARQLGDDQLVSLATATLGQVSASVCDYDNALVQLAAAPRPRPDREGRRRPAVGYAYTLACKASVLGDRGCFRAAHECLDEALEAVQGAHHEVEGSVLCWRSGVWLWQGRWDEAQQAAAEAHRIAERVKSLYLYTMSLSLGSYAAWIQQRDPSLVQTMADSTSWLAGRDRGLFISLNYGWVADAMASSGRWAEARRSAARAVRRGRLGDRLGAAMALRALARGAAAGQGRRPPRRYLDLAMHTARLRGSPHEVAATQLCEAEILLAHGDLAAAGRLLDTACAAFERLEMGWHLAEAARLQGGEPLSPSVRRPVPA
jgi:class 3 adenylate cyclase/tetratricopeptide (TPR) repeat protein